MPAPLAQRTALKTKLLIFTSLLESALLMPGPVGKSLGCKVTLDLPEEGGQSRPSRQCTHRCSGRGLAWIGAAGEPCEHESWAWCRLRASGEYQGCSSHLCQGFSSHTSVQWKGQGERLWPSHVSGDISEHGTIATWKHTGKLSAGLRLIATKSCVWALLWCWWASRG